MVPWLSMLKLGRNMGTHLGNVNAYGLITLTLKVRGSKPWRITISKYDLSSHNFPTTRGKIMNL